MARTPKKTRSTTRRPLRASAPVSFAHESDDSDHQADNIDVEDQGAVESENEYVSMDLTKFMQEIQKRQAKKHSMLSAAFENQKKALFASGRQQAKDISREGFIYLENLKSTLMEAKKHEIPFDRYMNELAPLQRNEKAALESLYELYPSAIDDLFARRAQVVDAASEMLRHSASRRDHALKCFLQKAREQLDLSHRRELEATDASVLIKHYKALLLS